ncbi:MAG TPA: hypothetical protein VNQ73_02195 [Ilumatobacter sp.]|nr:hypothetical protein [Ilumatobacter sp.]
MDTRTYASPARGFDASIRLATGLSLVAIVFALLAHLAAVPEQAIVLSVIVVGFAASWVRSGRAAGRQPTVTAVTVSAAPRAW